MLRSGEPAEKAIACKELAIHGSKACVPELAKLLADERLASWARIALEAIPDPTADEALRSAMDKLDGKLLVGVINSIGVRRGAGAVDPLARRLKDQDAEVASRRGRGAGEDWQRPGDQVFAKSAERIAQAGPRRRRRRLYLVRGAFDG